MHSANRGYYDDDEEGSMDNFIIDDGLDQEEEVRTESSVVCCAVPYCAVLYCSVVYCTAV